MKISTARIIALGLLTAMSGACSNSSMGLLSARLSTNTSSPGADATGPAYSMSNVTIAAGSGSAYNTRIYFSSTNLPGPLTDSCSLGNSSGSVAKPCFCVFTWDEMNSSSGTVVPVHRSVQTPVTAVQPQVVECAAPAVYASEIPDRTLIQIKLVPGSGNASQFTVNGYHYAKNSTAATGSFQDAEGQAFDNILRYSCYDQNQRGLQILSRKFSLPNPAQNNTSETAVAVAASAFCLSTQGNSSSTSQDCTGLRGSEYSAQSQYYNLYIRSADRGGINVDNTRFKCPMVYEPLSPATGVGGTNDFYPLDSSFALALTPSVSFPVGVEAATKIGDGDPRTSTNTSCFPSTTGTSGSGSQGGSTSLVQGCLGFAAKPAADGTCPSFKDSTGATRPTFRLRRYLVLYPPFFDTDGKMAQGSQPIDVVYVSDRPVSYSGSDPLKPYTMLGPKPCPFAYFDHKAVTQPPPGSPTCSVPVAPTDPLACHYLNGMPKYAATNDPAWEGSNIDGLQFPNQDVADTSCSAAVPILNADRSIWSIATIHRSNPVLPRLAVRPVHPWAPNYQEDTSFLACAPQANPFKDPPLHFARDPASGNIGWCAEVYPTQNPYIRDLERDPKTGDANLFVNEGVLPSGSTPTSRGTLHAQVAPFTSHVVKNSASAACSPSQLNLSSVPGYTVPAVNSCAVPGTHQLAPARHHGAYLVDFVPKTGASCDNGSTVSGGQCAYCANLTCDRTVQNPNLAWTKFPLLAPPTQVESAIISDPNFRCSVTYDSGNGKAASGVTPREGCCGSSVKLYTGVGGSGANLQNMSAHLEPDASCLTPGY